jgi:hypothetical protein
MPKRATMTEAEDSATGSASRRVRIAVRAGADCRFALRTSAGERERRQSGARRPRHPAAYDPPGAPAWCNWFEELKRVGPTQ